MRATASNRKWLENGIYLLLVLALAAGLKIHYSHASSGDLEWILRPTAAAVEVVSGIAFHREAGTGYVNQDRRVIIAPSCAGVNFLIIAFAMAAVYGIPAMWRGRHRAGWIVAALAIAYGSTIAVNAVRITAAIHLYALDIYNGAVTPGQVHRVGGVVVYFAGLCFLHLSLERLIGFLRKEQGKENSRIEGKGSPRPGRSSVLVPLFWYTAVTLGVPLVSMTWRGPDGRFVTHALTVGLVCLCVSVAIQSLRLCFRCVGAKKGRIQETAKGSRRWQKSSSSKTNRPSPTPFSTPWKPTASKPCACQRECR